MWYPSLRTVYEEFVPPQASHESKMAGASRFAEKFCADLGLRVNEYGRPIVKDAKFKPGEFSLRAMAEAVCGYEWVERLQGSTARSYSVFEAGGSAITPADLPNVSAYLGSVSGLLDAAILEAYDTPEFLCDQLCQTVPSKTRQTKIIGVSRIGDASKKRNPGEAHQSAQLEGRMITTPETSNDALMLEVTFEAVFYDQTGQVLERANAIGEEMALRKELDCMKVISGTTNPYIYNDVAYNTYLTSGNWINDQVNPLEDWTDINTVYALFARMTDQETGQRIAVNWDTILVAPAKRMTAQYIENATEIETATASGTQVRRGQKLGETYRILSTPYMDQVLTAASPDGLAVSQATAEGYWWCLRTQGGKAAFVRVENWPVEIKRAGPSEYTMLNRKILLAVFADQQHVFGVREPRYVIRNKPA